MRFDLQKDGFPAITTKRLAFKSVIGELIGFLRATRSAADFRALECKVWDQNANENVEWLANPNRLQEDDLGPVYGVQWRAWPAYKLIEASKPLQLEDAVKRDFRIVSAVEGDGKQKRLLYKAIDQLRECFDTLIKNPGSRRILFHGWNCADSDAIARPACHLLYRNKKLDTDCPSHYKPRRLHAFLHRLGRSEKILLSSASVDVGLLAQSDLLKQYREFVSSFSAQIFSTPNRYQTI